jgi:hypothetical protein
MKRKIVFCMALVALLCFAMPAIASPPVALPTLEPIGLAVNTATYSSVDVPAFVAASPEVSTEVPFVIKSSAIIVSLVAFGFALKAMLAGFKKDRATNTASKLPYDPRRRVLALARDQT